MANAIKTSAGSWLMRICLASRSSQWNCLAAAEAAASTAIRTPFSSKTCAILEAVGPAALTTDPRWGSDDSFLEAQQRNGIVAVHPGGTADIQKVEMARRIGIGRTTRQAAGKIV